MKVSLCWLAVVLSAAMLCAGEITITFRMHGPAPQQVPAVIRFTPIRTTRALSATAPSDCIETMAAAGAVVAVPLGRGVWAIDVEAAGLWHQRQFATLYGDRTDAAVDLWPAGMLTGSGEVTGSGAPDDLRVRFAPIEQAGLKAGEVRCEIEKGRFRCVVPAGLHDLRFKCDGCVPRFLWETRVGRGGTTSVGTLLFDRGASLIGSIDVALLPPTARATVTARPANVPDPASSASRLRELSTQADGRGFFHIDGIAPGRYSVSASSGPYRSESIDVVVMPHVMVELRGLAVALPQRLQLVVHPAHDPDGDRWHVRLTRSLSINHAAVAADARTGEDGAWQSPPLNRANYELTVGPAAGGEWYRRTIDGDSAAPLPVNVPSQPLAGVVTLGGKPLAAKVTLISGDVRVALQSAADGTFRGHVPDRPAAHWTAVVETELPRVHRSFEVDIDPASTLRLDIPLVLLSGSVTDRGGKRVRSLVNLRPKFEAADRFIQTRTTAAGEFVFAGLTPGEYEVHAEEFLRSSRVVTLTVDAVEGAEADLVLEDEILLNGRVLSDFGSVPGADLMLSPTDVPAPPLPLAHTNERGEFSAAFPAGTGEIDLALAAPGFAFRLGHVRLQSGALTLKVQSESGVLEVPSLATRGRSTFIGHAGAVVAAQAIAFMTNAARQERRADGRNWLVLEEMEPGPYAVCALTAEELVPFNLNTLDHSLRCSTGFLAPGSTLVLSPPE